MSDGARRRTTNPVDVGAGFPTIKRENGKLSEREALQRECDNWEKKYVKTTNEMYDKIKSLEAKVKQLQPDADKWRETQNRLAIIATPLNIKRELGDIPEAYVRTAEELVNTKANQIKAETRLAKVQENINVAYDNQVKVVKLVCNNIAGEVLQFEKLQDVVIYHLGLMKREVEETLE
jgi:hypothetical protein